MSGKPREDEVLSIDKRARDEVICVLEACSNSSEMDDKDHLLHEDFRKTIDLVRRFLSA